MKFIILSACLLMIFSCVAVRGADPIDGILAKVDTEVITQSDMAEAMSIAYLAIRENYPEDQWESKLQEENSRLLNRMIDDLVCLRFARENGMSVNDEQIDQQINSLKEKAGITSDTEFAEALKQEGLTLEELRENTRRNIIKQRVLGREVYARIDVSDPEIKRYYNENEDIFKETAQVKIGLLLLEVKEQDEASSQTVEQKIKSIYSQLQQGKSFTELVSQFSQGPSKDDGGDIGYIKKGEGLPELEKIAFSMEEGDFSEPFQTAFGWNIVKILEYNPANLIPLTDVQDHIRSILQRQKSRDIEQDWFEVERSKTYIEINDLP